VCQRIVGSRNEAYWAKMQVSRVQNAGHIDGSEPVRLCYNVRANSGKSEEVM
jgi:hypothetical protein